MCLDSVRYEGEVNNKIETVTDYLISFNLMKSDEFSSSRTDLSAPVPSRGRCWLALTFDVCLLALWFPGRPESQHAGRPGGLLRCHQPIRELGEHDHHLLHQGLLLRQAGGREGGGEDAFSSSSKVIQDLFKDTEVVC